MFFHDTEHAEQHRLHCYTTLLTFLLQLVVVEGEMDALSVYEAGIHNVVSVPDGEISLSHSPVLSHSHHLRKAPATT